MDLVPGEAESRFQASLAAVSNGLFANKMARRPISLIFDSLEVVDFD
jgi:hypothetical protein